MIFQYGCEDIMQSNQLGWLLTIVFCVALAIVICVLAYIYRSKTREIEYLKTLIPASEQLKIVKTPKGICPSCGSKFQDKSSEFCSRCGEKIN